jgi:hypothetical protein
MPTGSNVLCGCGPPARRDGVVKTRCEEHKSGHGRDCHKVKHIGGGYLHDADDDKPYDVDGVMYCGRCHGWLS